MLLASTYVNEAFYGRHGFFVPERKQLRYGTNIALHIINGPEESTLLNKNS